MIFSVIIWNAISITMKSLFIKTDSEYKNIHFKLMLSRLKLICIICHFQLTIYICDAFTVHTVRYAGFHLASNDTYSVQFMSGFREFVFYILCYNTCVIF